MSIVKTIMQFATPMLVERLASAMGVNSSLARMALTYAVPAILSAFTAKASSPAGASALLSAVRGTDPNMLSSLEGMLGSPAQAQFSQAGSSMLGTLLGQGGVNNLVSSLSKNAGIGSTAAAALLPLVGQMALGGIAKSSAGMDANGLASLLTSQASSFAAPASAPSITASAPAASGSNLLRWAIPALAAAALAYYFTMSPSKVATEVKPAAEATTTAPAAVDISGVSKTLTDTLGGLTTTLGTITNAETAASALPRLQDATTAIDGLGMATKAFGATEKTAIGGLLATALPAVRAAADKALAIEGVGPIAKPVLDTLFAKIEALAK